MPVLDLRTLTTRLPSLVVLDLVGELVGVGREHPDDLDVAAERDRLDAVLGLAALPAPDGGAEADEVLGDLPAELLRGDHVAELVEADRRQDREHEDHDTRAGRSRRVSSGSSAIDAGRLVASPRVGGEDVVDGQLLPRGYVVAAEHVRRPWRRSATNGSRPARKASTPPRWRRCRPPGAVPPALPRPPGQADRREGLVVEREELPGLRPGPVDRRARRRATRSGQARPSAIGISIVGGLAWTSVEPSTNSTIECTTRGRVHHDLDPVEGDAEEQVRLDHLEALVDQGRGVDRDDRAHVPGRVGQRLLDGDVGQLRRGCGRGTGRRVAVSTSRRTSSGEPPRRHWASAECSESTGTIWPGLARSRTSGPPMISDSLLARASVLPASSAARVGRRPTAPVMPLSTTSQDAPAASAEASSPSPENAGRELGHLRLEELRVATTGGQRRPPGTGRGWPARGRAPGCRSSRSSRARRRRGGWAWPHCPRSARPRLRAWMPAAHLSVVRLGDSRRAW